MQHGGNDSLDRIVPRVYADRRRMAADYFYQKQDGHTRQPTSLVHEAYLCLMGQEQPDCQNRAHLGGAAEQVMRRFFLNHARRIAATGGGGIAKVPVKDKH